MLATSLQNGVGCNVQFSVFALYTLVNNTTKSCPRVHRIRLTIDYPNFKHHTTTMTQDTMTVVIFRMPVCLFSLHRVHT